MCCTAIPINKRGPQDFLFERQETGRPYNTRSATKNFNRITRSAANHKYVNFHALRYRFATHLLEKGVNIMTIKGYQHAVREKLAYFQSPLDYMDTDI